MSVQQQLGDGVCARTLRRGHQAHVGDWLGIEGVGNGCICDSPVVYFAVRGSDVSTLKRMGL